MIRFFLYALIETVCVVTVFVVIVVIIDEIKDTRRERRHSAARAEWMEKAAIAEAELIIELEYERVLRERLRRESAE